MNNLKYSDEQKEDAYYQQFLDDTKGLFNQMERATIRDFIKWAIIKGFLK